MKIIPYTGNVIRVEGNNKRLRRMTQILSCDTVTFSGMMTGKEFKKRCGKFMTCLYSGTPMVEDLNKLANRGVFKGGIGNVVKKMEYYENCLDNSEAKLYAIIKEKSVTNPTVTLSQLLEGLISDSSKEIRKIQRKCIDNIKNLGANLPEDKLDVFYKYLNNADRKIYDEPIREEFSMKAFKYNIIKLSEYITDTQLRELIQKYIKLMPKSHNDFKKVPKNKYYKAGKSKTETAEQTAELIDAIRDMASKKGFRKIERYCQSNIRMLYGEPVKLPFSNKAFKYDLMNILNEVEDTKLVEDILAQTNHLPTSADNLKAYILKFKDMDETMIGTKIFGESAVSVEHLHPASLGGSSYMVNCGLAKKWINSKRQSKPLGEVLKEFPIENQQKYVDNLAKCVEKGLVSREEALMHIETIEEEGKILLDKSALLKF